MLYYFIIQEDYPMINVFVKKSAEELHVQLSDGRMMPFEDLVRDYERLLKQESSKKAIASEPEDDNKAITQKQYEGEWFRIDKEVIDKSQEEIRCKCNEAGTKGKALWERFKKSNKIADENPDQYPRLIETYIFKHNWYYKTEQEMRDMCKDVGDGMCDEIIYNLELQMRICNGESSVDDLVKKADKLPRVRVIKLRNGASGYFGGGTDDLYDFPPASYFTCHFDPRKKHYKGTPCAFRRVLS